MQFKDIKQNYPVFVLDKKEMTVTTGKATAVGFPRMEMNPKTGKQEIVVDVTIEASGKTGTYTIPEGHSVTYADGIVLSTTQQGLATEIEALQNAAKQYFEMKDYQQKVLDKAPSLLAELNPVYKERQETENRFNKIEGSISEMKELMMKQQEMMSGFIKKFES